MTAFAWVCSLGLMIDPALPAPHSWFAVESPAPFIVGQPHDVIDPLWYDAERDIWRMTGTTWAAVPVFLAPGQSVCIWFAGDTEGPRLCLPPGWSAADADGNGAVDSRDISAFLSRWVGSMAGGTPEGDFNADLHVDSGDVAAFLAAWVEALE